MKTNMTSQSICAKTFLGLAIGLLPLFAFGQAASPWKPSNNVEIIAPAGAGSALDQTARILQKIAQDKNLLDVTAAVVNKAGGGQVLGFNYLNQHPADGHFISIGTISLITNRITGVNPLNYTDVTPIANLVAEYIVFAVRTESPLKNGKDMAARMRRDPAGLSLSFSGSLGNHNHMAIGLVAKAAGADLKKLKTVVFNSGGELAAAVLGGHIDVAIGGSSVFNAHVQSGRLRLIAVTSPKRLGGELADIPTWSEQGIPANFATFRGIVGPKGLAAAMRHLDYACDVRYPWSLSQDMGIIEDGPVLANGMVSVPDGPGLGLKVAWERVKTFAEHTYRVS